MSKMVEAVPGNELREEIIANLLFLKGNDPRRILAVICAQVQLPMEEVTEICGLTKDEIDDFAIKFMHAAIARCFLGKK